MKDRKQWMIKIAAAAVATSMYTCMSGQRRSHATLTHVSNKVSSDTSLSHVAFRREQMCSATSTAPHQKYRGNQRCAVVLSFQTNTNSLLANNFDSTVGKCHFLITFFCPDVEN